MDKMILTNTNARIDTETVAENTIYHYFNPYFSHHEVDMFFAHNTMMHFSEGTLIFQQGKYIDGLYIIINGNVNTTAKILGEGVTNIAILGPGDFLGEISFFEKTACTTTAIAKTEVNCLFITKTYVEMLSAYFPESSYKIYHAITKQICKRISAMHENIIDMISNSEMATLSFFKEMINSLSKPAEISYEDADINMMKIQQSTSFNGFTLNELDELFKQCVLLKAAKNCTIIHKSDVSMVFYIVIHGAVQSGVIHENKSAKLSVIGPNTLFTNLACLEDNPSYAMTFIACEQVILFSFSKKGLEALHKDHLILWYKINYLIFKSLVSLEKSIDKLSIRLNIEIYNR